MLGFWLMMSSAATFFHCTFFDSRFTHCVPSTTARKDSQKAAGRDRRGRAEPGDGGGGEPIFFAFSLHSPNAKRKMTNEKKKSWKQPPNPKLFTPHSKLPGNFRLTPDDDDEQRIRKHAPHKSDGPVRGTAETEIPARRRIKTFFLESNDPFHYCSFSSLAQW